MKRKITLLRLTIVIAVLASVGIAMAAVLPPPANQMLGIYDTEYPGFDEAGCRGCHSSGVPNTHHLLVQNEGYKCTDCHPPGPNGGVTAIRNCVVCHTASPHHITDAAKERQCSECHGDFVDDYDDGHYIPDYESSLITPNTSYRYINTSTGKKWGGCEACHEPDASMTPVVDSNSDTHHGAVTAITCSGTVGNICHAVTGPEPPIRGCEGCHGVNSIHNIQYDYAHTKDEPGYGHIGEAWDCMGCHAWYEAYKGELPIDPIIVPSITAVSPSSLVTGEETEVTILGDNFVTTVEGTTYTSNVVIDGDELIPEAITATEITVTIPALDTGNYGLYAIKAGLKSNLLPVVVAPEVSIESATVDANGVVTITGKGFGDIDPTLYDECLGVEVTSTSMKVKKIQEPLEVVKWENKKVVFKSQKALDKGASVDVTTAFGNDNAPIEKPTP